MELSEITFLGLMSVGFVNVLGFLVPNLKSEIKFALSFIFAFALTFVPADMASHITQKAVQALEVALTASGAYKLAQKAGGE